LSKAFVGGSAGARGEMANVAIRGLTKGEVQMTDKQARLIDNAYDAATKASVAKGDGAVYVADVLARLTADELKDLKTTAQCELVDNWIEKQIYKRASEQGVPLCD
jgi:hypothetical protein